MKRVMIWVGLLAGILTLTTVFALYAAQQPSTSPDSLFVVQDSPSYGYDPTYRLLFPNQRRSFALISGLSLEFIAAADGRIFLRDWGEVDSMSHEFFSLSISGQRHQSLARLSRAAGVELVWTAGHQWLLYPAFDHDDLMLMRVRVDGRDRENLTEGLSGDLAHFLVAPDGQSVFITLLDAKGQIAIYRRSLVDGDMQRWLDPSRAHPTPVYVFPAGKRLLILRGYSLYLLNEAGDEPFPVGSGEVTQAQVNWLASKNVLVIGAYASPGRKVFAADSETGNILWTEYDASLLSVSPDDEWVYLIQSGLSLKRLRWDGHDSTVIERAMRGDLGWNGPRYFFYNDFAIRAMQPDGTVRDVLAFPPNTASGGGWFIQDDWAYFTLSGAEGDNIFRVRLDGRDFEPVTAFHNRRAYIVGSLAPIFEEWRSYWHPLVGGIILLLVSLALSANPLRRVK